MTQGLIALWKADHLRVSLFSNKPWDVAPEAIYADVFANAPDATSQKPAAGEAIASGNWSSGRVEIKRTINRIDCILQSPLPTKPELPLLSDVEALLSQFASLLSGWATNQSQDVVRIALGCNGLMSVTDVNEGYRKLHEMVRVINVDAERFRDMQFQVNLPAQSKSDQELLLNRLTTWSTVQVQAGIFGPGAVHAVENAHYCVCSIDINTDGDRTIPLLKSGIGVLINEMCQEAIGILDRGIE